MHQERRQQSQRFYKICLAIQRRSLEGLHFFAGDSFLKSFGTILERAAYVDDGDM